MAAPGAKSDVYDCLVSDLLRFASSLSLTFVVPSVVNSRRTCFRCSTSSLLLVMTAVTSVICHRLSSL